MALMLLTSWILTAVTDDSSSARREVSAPITALIFAPDGKALLSASQAGVQIYSWPGLEKERTLAPLFSHVHDLAFSPSGERLAIAGGVPGDSGKVEIVEWPEGKSLQKIEAGKDVVYGVAWSGDASRLALAGADKTVRIHELKSGKTTELTDHSAAVLAVLFISPRKDEASAAELLLSAGRDQTIRVFDAKTARALRSLDNHTSAVNDLALRPGHADELPLIASAGRDKTVRFWQPAIGRLMRFVRLPAPVLAVRWLPDGEYVVAGCSDGQIRVVDPQTAAVVLEKKVCDGWATALAISPDGKRAIVGDERGELHVVSLDGIKRP